MSFYNLVHFAAIAALSIRLAAGEAAFYVSMSPQKLQGSPAMTVNAPGSWTTVPYHYPPARPFQTIYELPGSTPHVIGTPSSRLRRKYATPMTEQRRICNDEKDFNPHPDIDSSKQLKGAVIFCSQIHGDSGYLGPGVLSERLEFRDLGGVIHHFKVEWAATCVTAVDMQLVRLPLGLESAINCAKIMRENYLNCEYRRWESMESETIAFTHEGFRCQWWSGWQSTSRLSHLHI